MLLSAIGAAQKKYGPGRRPVLIHGQFMREDQVDTMKALGVFPSLFPMHTFYWGDWHRDHTVGPVAADDMSPTGWVMQRGMMFGTHHDAPVAFPDAMRVLDATVTRRSRSGDILGPKHRVPVEIALMAMTIWPAWQHFEEDRKGSLAPGKVADLVVLSGDPTAIDPEQLDALRVEQTIKADKLIYQAPPASGRKAQAASPALGSDGGQAFAQALQQVATYSELMHLPASDYQRRVAWLKAAGPQHTGACLSGYLMRMLSQRPALVQARLNLEAVEIETPRRNLTAATAVLAGLSGP